MVWSAEQGDCRCIDFVFSEQLCSLLYSQRTQSRLRYSQELASLIIQQPSFNLSQCYYTL